MSFLREVPKPRLEAGLERLPLYEMVAVLLHCTYDFSFEEVALSMEVNPEDATELVMGGLEKLRGTVFNIPAHEHSTVAHALGVERSPSTLAGSAGSSVYVLPVRA